MATRIYLETGAQRVFACSVDWIGWARSAKRGSRQDAGEAQELAMQALADYWPRYAPIAAAAGWSCPATTQDRPRRSRSWSGSPGT